MRKEIVNVINKICDNTEQKDYSIFRQNIIFLKDLLELSNLDFYEKGIIYWQLQDHYALLRDYDNELKVFNEFTSYVRKEKKDHLFWTVCDMTQVLTMRLGGYGTCWDEVYHECLNITTDSDEFVRMKLEMLRSYIGIFTDERVLIKNSDIEIAIDGINELIITYPNHPDILFFKMCYYVSVIKYNNYIRKDYSNIISELKSEIHNINESLLVKESDVNHETLFGSWEQISMSKGNSYSSKVGLTNILFALVEANDIKTIKYLLKKIRNFNLTHERLILKINKLNEVSSTNRNLKS